MLPAGRRLCVTEGSWARLCRDRSGTAEQLGLFPLRWHLGSSPPCPAPSALFFLHPVHAVGAAWGPWAGRQWLSHFWDVFQLIPRLQLVHEQGVSCVMEPFVCCGLPRAPCPRWGCQALVGAPGWFLATSRELQAFSFPKERRSQKLPAGEVRSGQGNPNPLRDMAGTGAFPPAAVADCTGK